MGQSTRCEKCGRLMQLGEWPFCPHGVGASSVRGDEIDVVIENNGTSEPIRFRSREVLRRHLAAYKREPFVRHVPVPGSDKSPHTTDWSKGSIDAQTLENARVLLSRGSLSAEQEPEPVPMTWTVRELPETFTVKRDDS